MLRWVISLATLMVMSVSPGAAFAESTSTVPFVDLVRREWSVADAVPPFVQHLAIDQDGFLWMRGSTGLYRFDGASFTAINEHRGVKLPSSPPRHMASAPNGSIWVSYGEGRIAVLSANGVKVFTSNDGLPATANIDHIAFGAGGAPWASTSQGLFVAENDRWRELESEYTQGRYIHSTLVDSKNRLWIVASHGLFVRSPETGAIEPIYLGNSLGATFAESPNGTVWLSRYAEDSVCQMRKAVIGDCFVVPRVNDLMFDRDGTLWGTATSILFRIQRAEERLATPAVDVAALTETLYLDTNTVLVDKDDQVWVVGDNHLTRFRTSSVSLAATPSGAIAPAPGGEAWVASFGRGLSRIGQFSGATANAEVRAVRSEDGAIYLERGTENHRWRTDAVRFRNFPLTDIKDRTIVLDRFAEAGSRLVRVDRDRNGGVWVAAVGPAHLFHSATGDRFSEVVLPKLDGAALVRGVAVDAKGVAWLAVSRNKEAPLYALEHGAWQAKPANGLEASALVVDTKDQLWVALGGGKIARLTATGWFTISDENPVGGVAALAASRDAVWVGGSLGIAAVVNDVLRPLLLATAPQVLGITGLVADKDGNLWINSVDGLLCVVREEIRKALDTPSYRAAVVRVDRFDGVNGYAIQNGPYPTLAQSDDGRVWFTTSQGLYSVAPENLTPAAAPRSYLTDVVMDDQQRALTSESLILPPRTQRVTMRFTAPHLRSAERIQFRYRLRPFETEWQYSGLKREAIYTNLDPGSYTFEVQASNDHGAWLGEIATLSLQAQPAFVQTRTFVALCIVAVMLLLAALYGLRMRQVAARLLAEGNARHAERERIARELHDTLLQGMQALILRLDGITKKSANIEWQKQIAPLLDEAEAVLEEGRDRVHQLNAKVGLTLAFVDALTEMGARLAQSHSCRFEIAVDGKPMDLGTNVADELLRLAQEAMSNAARHSQCRVIKAEIRYDSVGMKLLITDDGQGIDTTVLRHGKPGHFGLEGMRQRAALLGASLEIRNTAQGGAQVAVQLPASAYARGRHASR